MDLFGQYAEKLKPHAVRLGTRAESYAERIIARLDAIHSALDNDDPDTAYRSQLFTVNPGDTLDCFVIPPGQTWELKAFNITSATAGSYFVYLLDDGRFCGGIQNDGPSSGPSGLTFRGGSVIQLFQVASYEGLPMNPALVYLQFKLTIKKPSKRVQTSGAMEWSPLGGGSDPRQDAQQDSRHATPGLVNGRNPVGENA